MRLPQRFFQRDDVLAIARELLGSVLCTRIDGQLTAARVVETEAYAGPEDRASHAWRGRRTRRTETMYRRGGCAYVYLCYGMHHLFNVVTNQRDVPHAVLVRAAEPLIGVDIMAARRRLAPGMLRLTSGPGALSQALGITTALDGAPLQGPELWFRRGDAPLGASAIAALPRVGVAYAGEHAARPWRFVVSQSRYITHPRG